STDIVLADSRVFDEPQSYVLCADTSLQASVEIRTLYGGTCRTSGNHSSTFQYFKHEPMCQRVEISCCKPTLKTACHEHGLCFAQGCCKSFRISFIAVFGMENTYIFCPRFQQTDITCMCLIKCTSCSRDKHDKCFGISHELHKIMPIVLGGSSANNHESACGWTYGVP